LLRFKPACKALGKSGPTLQRWSDTDNEDGMPFWDSKVFTVVNREVKGGTFRYWYESELKAAREALKVLSTKPRREDCYTVQDAMNLTGLSYNMLAQAKQCEARGFIKFNVRVKATRKKGDQKYSRTEKRILFHKVPIDAFVANRHSLGIPVGSLTVSDAAEDLKIDPQHIHRWCRDGLIAFEKRRLPSAAKPKRDQTHYILTSTVVTLLRQVLARSRSFAEAGRTLQQQQATISAPPVQPSTASAPEQFPCKPRWDGETRTLYLGDVVVKTFDRNSATNQLDLIEAFEREGWPSSVADPFRNRRRLDETMRYWNSSNGGEFIKFGGDGTGEGVRWRHTSKGH
jgi:hypothetical protein